MLNGICLSKGGSVLDFKNMTFKKSDYNIYLMLE